MAHLCSFTTDFEDLTKRQRRDQELVLEILRKNPRISTFEMDAVLWKTLEFLINQGRIEEVESAYPWHKFEVYPDA